MDPRGPCGGRGEVLVREVERLSQALEPGRDARAAVRRHHDVHTLLAGAAPALNSLLGVRASVAASGAEARDNRRHQSIVHRLIEAQSSIHANLDIVRR